MSDDFKVQYSAKVGADMHNFRGGSPSEVEAQFDEILRPDSEYITKAAEVGSLLRAAAVVTDGGAAASSQNTGSQQSSGHTCPHGNREYRTGNGRTGAWAAYFCPLPKGDANQCKPEFV